MLNFKHLGNPKKARKDLRCFCLEKIVDSDRTNLKDLIQSIIEQYPPGYMEVAHLQYHDHVLKSFPEVKTDQDLMLMFERHMNTKVVDMFIAYCDPSEQYHPITEWDSENRNKPNKPPGDTTQLDEGEDAYLRNPQPENEHVGVDDEGMYNEHVHGLDLVVYSAKDKDKHYVPVEDDEDEVESGSELGKSGSESESEIEEAEDLVGDDNEKGHVLDTEYDKEDRPMTEGTTYPNMATFKLALSQHAIKNEFEYRTVKSAPKRFTGICSRKNEDKCPWRIHASTTKDKQTIMVIILPLCTLCHLIV